VGDHAVERPDSGAQVTVPVSEELLDVANGAVLLEDRAQQRVSRSEVGIHTGQGAVRALRDHLQRGCGQTLFADQHRRGFDNANTYRYAVSIDTPGQPGLVP